eukprot:CAMPEP_0196598154 /NCGR_PEP_ID=MMETSP1081-20130531/94156_1 /TAXON_ID=36882 /ORGANISM="Pyramimonas amylifera, Strain CCMP720" /LENGTH=191 /DNA_ID=CAMNT_0041923807 /DNA_START=1298 /DNA_END=1873 /DNA_ORIENTATION=-
MISTLEDFDFNTSPPQPYQDAALFEHDLRNTQYVAREIEHSPSVSRNQSDVSSASYNKLEDDVMREKLSRRKKATSFNIFPGCDEVILSKEEEATIKDEICKQYANTKALRELRKEILVRSEKAKLPESAKKLMQDWCIQNLHNPYPTKEDKLKIAEKCDLDFTQIDDWFTNYRKRFWKKKIEFQTQEVSE